MKPSKPFTSIIFLLIISFISCEDRRALFADNIKKNVKSLSKPARTDELVKNFENKLTILCYTITAKEFKEMQIKYDLPDSFAEKLKAAPYARAIVVRKIQEKNEQSYFSYEDAIGASIKEEDNRISFAIIKVKSFANLKIRYDKIPKKKCHYILLFKKCRTYYELKLKTITPSEKILINKAAEYSAVQSLLKGAEILKRDDYELYMSDTGSIFSQDRKSVAHLTYFGDIAIGPISELNSILPLEYEYQSNFYKKVSGNFTLIRNYPPVQKVGKSNIYLNNGDFYKFNFITNDKVPRFISSFDDYKDEKSEKGPFILEVKKNGNVIVYEEKSKKIIWETKTAKKGKGPYNFYLTNDKKLILKDSTNTILYQSKDFIDIPTIYYGFAINRYNNIYVKNGQYLNSCPGNRNSFGAIIENRFNKTEQIESTCKYYPNYLRIFTENDKKYKIQYELRITETKQYFTYDNQGKFNPTPLKKKYNYELFSATINDPNLSICYTLGANNRGWTQIKCDGQNLNINDISGRYVDFLIIYVKLRGEENPTIFDSDF